MRYIIIGEDGFPYQAEKLPDGILKSDHHIILDLGKTIRVPTMWGDKEWVILPVFDPETSG